MAKPQIHAKSSAKKFGGKPEDYLHIHELMDSTKFIHATAKHRAIFHSAFGVSLVEQILGKTFTNSVGREIIVRDIAEQHILEDLGFIPSLDEYLQQMEIKPWMMGQRKAINAFRRSRRSGESQKIDMSKQISPKPIKIINA